MGAKNVFLLIATVLVTLFLEAGFFSQTMSEVCRTNPWLGLGESSESGKETWENMEALLGYIVTGLVFKFCFLGKRDVFSLKLRVRRRYRHLRKFQRGPWFYLSRLLRLRFHSRPSSDPPHPCASQRNPQFHR